MDILLSTKHENHTKSIDEIFKLLFEKCNKFSFIYL